MANAFFKIPEYNSDQKRVLSLLADSKKKNGTKICLMAAPSFVVDFDYFSFVPLMKSLGFDKVTELTFGAKVVNNIITNISKSILPIMLRALEKKTKIFKISLLQVSALRAWN